MTTSAIIAGIILVVTLVLMFSKKVSLPVAAGVGAILMAVCGIITPKVMLQQYSSSTIATMFGMMVIGGALFHTGAALYMGHFLTKFARNEKGLVLVCVIFGTIMSSIMSRSTCFFMFLPIIVSIALASDISLQKLLLPFVTGCSLGQQMTLVGCSTNLAINNSIIELGHEGIGFLEMTPFGILQFAICVPVILFIGLKLLPDEKIIPDMATLGDGKLPEKFTPKMGLSMGIMLVTMVTMAFDLEKLPTEMCAIIGGVLCVLCGCLDYKQAIKSVNWNSLFMIAGMTAVAKGIQESKLLSILLAPAINAITNVPHFLILILVFLICSVATQFMNDAALAAIMGPLLLPIAEITGIPAHVFGTASIFGVSAAMITPTCTSTAAPTIEEGHYSLATFAKFGLLIMAAKTVAVLLYFGIFVTY